MDKLQIKKAALVGQSLGAGIVIELCTSHPHRVDKLILVDAAGLLNPESLKTRIFMPPGVEEYLLRLPVNFIRRQMLDDFFLFDPKTITSKLFERLVRLHKIKGTILSALTIMRLRFADKLKPRIKQLSELNMPTLIAWGKNDKAISLQIGLQFHSTLNKAEFSVVKNAGHAPNLEQPAIFNSLSKAFLG